MQYAWTIVYVRDVAASLAFWETAFGLSRRFISDDGDYGELETGGTTIAFADVSIAVNHGIGIELIRPEGRAVGVELALTTDDVATSFARAVAAGAIPVKEPVAMPWGQTVSYVRDPNGVLVEVCTPVDTSG